MRMSAVAKYACLDCEDGVERSWDFLISHHIRKHGLPVDPSENAPIINAAIQDMNERPGTILKRPID